MFRKLLAAGVIVTGIGLFGTAGVAEARDHHDGHRHHDRGHRGHDHGHRDHGHYHGGHGHHGGHYGHHGRYRIQPYPHYGGHHHGHHGSYHRGSRWGGSGLYIGGRNFSFGYYGR